MEYVVFRNWLLLLRHNVFKGLLCWNSISFLYILLLYIIVHYVDIAHFVYPVISCWVLGLFTLFCYCESHCDEHLCTSIYLNICFQFFWVHTSEWNCLVLYNSLFNFCETVKTVFQNGCTIYISTSSIRGF